MIVRVLLIQKSRYKFATTMPGRKVRQIDVDHLGSIFELLLRQTFRGLIRLKRRALECFDYSSTIPPPVKIPVVKTKHLACEPEFLFPEFAGVSGWQSLCGLLQ